MRKTHVLSVLITAPVPKHTSEADSLSMVEEILAAQVASTSRAT